MSGDANDMDPAGGQFQGEQNVDPFQEHRVDGAQVAGDDRLRLGGDRQWVSAAELDTDLDVLVGRRTAAAPAGFRMPLTPADITLGRFFFVHRSQAIRDGTAVASYEFSTPPPASSSRRQLLVLTAS